MKIMLRFGMHQDIPVIHAESKCVDTLVIPAHILAYQLPSTSVFVTSLPDLPYLIDPVTYMLQGPKYLHLNEAGELRPSVERLCNELHPDLAELLMALRDKESLQPSQLPDMDELCGNAVEFELTKVRTGSSESRAQRYLDRYSICKATKPTGVVPPYFCFEAVGDVWYAASLRCADVAARICQDKGVPVMPVVFGPSTAFTSDVLRRLAKDYAGFPALFLWFDGYDERAADAQTIGGVRHAIKALSGNGRPVNALYGGYLMMLSAADGLAGISHGILYTQHKSHTLVPAGAGGVAERYYIPAFHEFRSLSQTDLILHRFPELVCDCRICSEVLKGDPDRVIRFSDSPELLRRHFLNVRRSEAQRVQALDLTAEVAQLRSAHRKYSDLIGLLPNPDAFISGAQMKGLSYLLNWADAFSG